VCVKQEVHELVLNKISDNKDNNSNNYLLMYVRNLNDNISWHKHTIDCVIVSIFTHDSNLSIRNLPDVNIIVNLSVLFRKSLSLQPKQQFNFNKTMCPVSPFSLENITGPTYIALVEEGADLLRICYNVEIVQFFFCCVQLTVSFACSL
jgi:hypothetical protein